MFFQDATFLEISVGQLGKQLAMTYLEIHEFACLGTWNMLFITTMIHLLAAARMAMHFQQKKRSAYTG